MSAIEEILSGATSWKLLSERQARETRRMVYLVDDRFVLKKFEVPRSVRSFRRPWIIEDKVLCRMHGDGAPRTHGFTEKNEGDHRVFWLAKEYLAGDVMETIPADDVPEIARLMAMIHRHLIITDDANIHNFLKRPDGSFAFVDFGRARNFIWRSPWFLMNIGWELAKLHREGFMRDGERYRQFMEAYFSQAGYHAGQKGFILMSIKLSSAMRMTRKALQGKSPWS
jgi:hypothetical protein